MMLDWFVANEWLFHQGVCWTLLVSGLFSFISLLVITAPYGRFSPENNKSATAAKSSSSPSSGWGPLINPKLAWVLMESPSSIVMLLMWLYGSEPQTSNTTNRVLLALFLFHYINRYAACTDPTHCV
jgi:hypothetical protein